MKRTNLSCFGFFRVVHRWEWRAGRVTYANFEQTIVDVERQKASLKQRCLRDNLICGFFYMDFCLLVFPLKAVVTVLWHRFWKRILRLLCSPVTQEEKCFCGHGWLLVCVCVWLHALDKELCSSASSLCSQIHCRGYFKVPVISVLLC